MARKFRLLINALLVLAAFTVVLAFTVLANRERLLELATKSLISALQQQGGLTVSYSALEGNPLTGLTFTDLEIRSDLGATPNLTAGRAKIHYPLSNLLHAETPGQLSLDLEHPQLQLRRLADGRLQGAELIKRFQPGEKPVKPMELSFQLREGSLILLDEQLGTPKKPARIVLTKLDGGFSLAPEGSWEIAISRAVYEDAQLSADAFGDLRTGAGATSFRVSNLAAGDWWRFVDLPQELRIAGGLVTGKGSVSWQAGAKSLYSVQANVQNATGSYAPLRLKGRIRADFALTPSALRFSRLEVATPHGNALARMQFQFGKAFALEGNAQLSSVDPAWALARAKGWGLDTSLYAPRAAGKLRGLAKFAYSTQGLKVELDTTMPRTDFSVQKVGSFRLEPAQAAIGFHWRQGQPVTYTASLPTAKVRALGLDTQRLHLQPTTRPILEGKLLVNSSPRGPQIRFGGKLAGLATEYGSLQKVELEGELITGRLALNASKLEGLAFGGKVQAHGTLVLADINDPKPGIQAAYTLEGGQLERVAARFWQEGELAGRARAEGVFSLDEGKWELDFTAAADETRLQQLALSKVTALGQVTNSGLLLTAFDANLDQARLSAEGTYAFAGDFAGKAHFLQLPFEALSPLFEAQSEVPVGLEGLFSGTLEAAGQAAEWQQTAGTFSLAGLQLDYKGVKLDAISLAGNLGAGNIELTEGRMVKGLSQATVLGTLEDIFAGKAATRLDLTVTSPALSVSELMALGLKDKPLPDVTGVLELAATISGTLDRPVGELTAQAKGLQAYGEVFSLATAAFDFSPAEVVVKELFAEAVGGGTLSAEGRIYYPLDDFANVSGAFDIDELSLAGLSIPRLQEYSLAGTVAGKGRVDGLLRDPEVSANLAVTEPAVQGERLPLLKADLLWKPVQQTLTARSMEVEAGSGQLIKLTRGQADFKSEELILEGNLAILREDGLERLVRFATATLQGVPTGLRLPSKAKLELKGDFQIQGDFNSPTANVKITSLNSAVGEVLLPPLEGFLTRFASGQVEADLHAQGLRALAEVKATLRPDGGLLGSANIAALDLALLRELFGLPVKGMVKVDGQLGGSLERPRLELALLSKEPSFKGVQVDEVRVGKLLLAEGRLQVEELVASLEGGQIRLNGETDFHWGAPWVPKEAPLKARLVVDKQPIYPLLQRFGQSTLYAGDLNGELVFGGTVRHPSAAGELSLTDGQVLISDIGALSQVEAHLAVESLGGASKEGLPQHRIRLVKGQAKLGEGMFEAEGSTDLLYFDKESLLRNPVQLKVTGRRLWFPVNSSPYVTNGQFELTAEGKGEGLITVALKELTGNLGEGTVRAGGQLQLSSLDPVKIWSNKVQVLAELTNASLALGNYGSGKLTGQLGIETVFAGERPVIGGDLVVDDFQAKLGAKAETDPVPWPFTSLRQSPNLNITLHTGQRVGLKHQRLEVAFTDSVVRVTGSLDAPLVTGELKVAGGRVIYPITDIELERGTVRLVEARPNANAPGWESLLQLDLFAKARVSQYRIEMHLYGPLEDMQVAMTSNPPLSQEQIYALLGGAANLENLLSGDLGGSLENELAMLLASEVQLRLFKGVETALQEALGLEEFRIKYDFNQNAEIVIGKELFDRFRVQYTRLISHSTLPSTETLRLSYELTPNITVSFENSELNRQTTFIEYNSPF